MNDKLNDALNEIEETYIAEAAQYRRKRLPYWFGAVAAVLAVALLVSGISPGAQEPTPTTQPQLFAPSTAPTQAAPEITAAPTDIPDVTVPAPSCPAPTITPLSGQVAAPVYPVMVQFPFNGDGYRDWQQSQSEQYDQPEGYADSLKNFFKDSITAVLGGSDKNSAYSPLNVYMALAMLAETSGGSSQQEILDALNTNSIESLRTQAGHVWNAHYCADGATTALLANSLWLDNAMADYHPETVQLLADKYYASVFHTDLGTEDSDNALAAWLDQQTGGLLREQQLNTQLDPDTVFALASTVYYRVQWANEFSKKRNTQGIFHTTDGDMTVTYMNRTIPYAAYQNGEGYLATALELEDGGQMWLILPDEGSTAGDLLSSGAFLDHVLYTQPEHSDLRVNVSLPKFDISSQQELSGVIQSLGIHSLFDSTTADFTPLISRTYFDGNIRVDKIDHAVRVAIDEDGLTAAAYTVMQAPGDSMPPDDEVDFVLDRPFIFLITSRDGLPLFAGVVNEP